MYKGLLHTHYLVVILFLLLYTVKTILLLGNRLDVLSVFSKKTRIFEMVVSTLFLVTGIAMATQLPFGSKYDYLFWVKILLVLASIPLAVIGFKKHNKILASLSLLMIISSFGLAESYSKRKNITDRSSNLTDSADGKTLYEANCKLCHGEDGKLGMAGATDLSSSVLEKNKIVEVILKGKGSMPPAGVDENQANLIADFVLTLRK
jgi:uncharacterized membrane protein SirB2